jgi:hypothetical protein
MKNRIAVIILLLALATPAWAGTSPWFVWRNAVSGSTVCAQSSPGPGWMKETGPYSDLRCTTRAERSQSIDRKVAPKQ